MAYRQERSATKFEKQHNRSGAMLLTEHLSVATAAFELSTHMSSMLLPEYISFASKLDEAQISLPHIFCVQALFYVAHTQLMAGCFARDMSEMFVLKTPPSFVQNPFKAAAPRLHNITEASPAIIEKVLGDGLFGIVILHFMNLPDGVHSTATVAETLLDGCNTAMIMAATSRPSIVAGSGMVSSRTPAMPAEWAWVSELQDIASAILCVATDQNSQTAMDALLRVQDCRTGRRKVLANLLKKEPWSKHTQDTWKYGLGSVTIAPKVQEALQACGSDPEAWARAATLIPGWKTEVRPGTTTELEEMLWQTLNQAWLSFDAEDPAGSAALVDRLRLARRLEASSRPTDAVIDLMEATAPRPQLIMPAQSCGPKLQPDIQLRLLWRTLCHTVRCLAEAGEDRSSGQRQEARGDVPVSCQPGAALRERLRRARP